MNASIIVLYTSSCVMGALIPGPTSLLAMSNGASGNVRKVAIGMVGAALSDILVIAAVGIGLGAMLMASQVLFAALKWLGVCYLAWLGVQLWRSHPQALAESTVDTSAGHLQVFWRSFSVAMTNPKVLLFFTAFLPQFIDPTEPALAQYAVLAVISACVDCVVMALYAAGGIHLAKVLTQTGMRRLNQCCGVVMLSLAGFLALHRRS
ncbi:MAG: LysE family translocator [Pseudomonas sp.]|uniref:LysE family translocator n=1 Tax=Pseudomonas abieticivorans TaxID=2931382 RepID=UPI0020BE4988|nr:LysE family translocator [Pseudomonas sp. PIA16]MDE1166157.1 LysE family translocator [Pseudomonas sp.]